MSKSIKTAVHFSDYEYNCREYGFFLGFLNASAQIQILKEKPYPNDKRYIEIVEFKTKQELFWFIRKEGLQKYIIQ